MSLSLSLISLTIAVLCMINVKYATYFFVKLFCYRPADLMRNDFSRPRPPKPHFYHIPSHLPLVCQYFLTFRRLHLPRNLLHMHLFVAFIFRSIVKLIFIHIIIGGYTRPMITYTRDECGNIEILSKSSSLFHVSSDETIREASIEFYPSGHRLSSLIIVILVHRCRLANIHLLRSDVSLHSVDQSFVSRSRLSLVRSLGLAKPISLDDDVGCLAYHHW